MTEANVKFARAMPYAMARLDAIGDLRSAALNAKIAAKQMQHVPFEMRYAAMKVAEALAAMEATQKA